MLGRIRGRAAEERGAVVAIVALFAPVLILFCSFMIDAGNNWWHQRHLQVQADAAALAAAQDMWPCSPSLSADAQQYGGITGSPVYNTQVGGTGANVHQLINSPTYYNQTDPVDSSVVTGSPCTAMMTDVKMTETGLPWYFRVFQTPFINAHARVELRQLSVSSGQVPISVNDVRFASGEVYFINKTTGAVQSEPLADQGLSNGLEQWASPAYQLTVPSAADSDVAVRVAFSGAANLTGNMTSDCALPGVLCYDATASGAQLLDVHGYSTTTIVGSPSSPINRGVTMTPGTCGDQYFTVSTTSCTDGVKAVLDLGPNPKLTGGGAGLVTVSVVGASGNMSCTYDATSKLTTCTGTTGSLAPGSGRNQVNVAVAVTKGATTTLNDVQSTYAGADANSGPIQALSLYADGVSDSSSLAQGSQHSVVVQVGITPSISVASPGDPPIVMRFSGVGSQNQSVSCTPVSVPQNFDNWGGALATGCQGPYQINQALTCPDTITPVDCVPPATGNQQNKVAKALNYRILGSTKPTVCTAPNNWPTVKFGDPRIVTTFVTPYGSFGGSGGSTTFPIQYFAAFYITGWADNGNGYNNPCQGNGDDTAAGGTMVGHFIHYVQILNNGSSGTSPCVLNSLNECVAVLTR
jgi:hypothetical protein